MGFIAAILLASVPFANSFSTRNNGIPLHSSSSGGKLCNERLRKDDVYLCSSASNGDNNKDNDDSANNAVTDTRGGDATTTPLQQPSFASLVRFYVPCLALWTTGPLLSLIDTVTVGKSARVGEGALQLGAMGPATTFIDGATYLFAFLNVATTNLYASARAQGRERKCRSVVTTAAKVSLWFCGLGIAGLLWCAGKPLLRLYMGQDAAAVLLTPASRYVWIRAASMPTSLWYGVVQASLLGAKDSVTPLKAIGWSASVNLIGDLICVTRLRMGVEGAAFATVLAQWAGTAAMIMPAKRQLMQGSDTPFRQLLGFKPPAVTTASKDDKEDLVDSRSFLAFAAPVLTLILGKLAAFGFMTHVAAALPNQPAALAAHQIALTLFFLISPFLEVMSQTAQTFLPQFYQSSSHDEADVLARRLLGYGLVLGAVVATVAAAIPKFVPHFLTNDVAVWDAVRPLATPLWWGGLLTAPVAVSEGVLLARRELGFLAGVYVVSTALLPAWLLRIKRINENVNNAGVVRVWTCFAAFQLFRGLCFTGKLWGGSLWRRWRSRRNENVTAVASE